MKIRSIYMPTSQPVDWIEVFDKCATDEGVSLSEWVGIACLKKAACHLGLDDKWVSDVSSARARRGRPAVGEVQK
jgi:hypothetical protein